MIPTLALEFDIQSEQPIKFNGFSGVALRGALFQALNVLYTGNDPSISNAYQTDPVLHLMMRLNSLNTITRNTVSPFVIRTPDKIRPHELAFGISLFGQGRKLLPYVTSAVEAMGVMGIGTNRSKFEVKAIRQTTYLAKSGLDEQIEVFDTWARLVDFSENNPINNLEINFFTPTTIIQDKRLCMIPTFKVWFHRLLERILHLNSLSDNSSQWIPVNELLARAEAIEMFEDNTTQFGEMRSARYSRNIVGFQGCVKYRGDFTSLFPYIALGEKIHVGKNAVKGCGRYMIEGVS